MLRRVHFTGLLVVTVGGSSGIGGSEAVSWTTRQLPGGALARWTVQLVSAVVRPVKVSEICGALQALGFRGLTVTEVSGLGKLRERPEIYRGAEYASEFQRRVKVEIVVPDDDVDDVVELICVVAATGHLGDGKLWVTPVGEVVRLRTRERGREAL